jgi:integrase
MLLARPRTSALVFGGASRSTVSHQHTKVRRALKLPEDFVVHGLRHTFLTRLGESGCDTFTLMKIAGHSTIGVSARYVHPTPESMERAFDRLETPHNFPTARRLWSVSD